jgi:hypothetical protein
MLESVDLASGCAHALRRETIVRVGRCAQIAKEIAVSRIVSAATHRKEEGSENRSKFPSARFVGVAIAAVVVFAVAVISSQPRALQAASESRVDPNGQASMPREPTALVVETERTLKSLREELAAVAINVLTGIDVSAPTEGDIAGQSLMIESAKARYQSALLAREGAEIALKEYEEAILTQEKASLEEELKLARAELEKAQGRIKPANDRLARIKQLKNGTTDYLVNQWRFEWAVVAAELQVQKAKFVVDQAQSKLNVLLEYQQGKTIRELKSKIEKARSDELAKKATWQLEQSKLSKVKQMQDPTKSQSLLTASRKRILGLLDRAIPIEEHLIELFNQFKQANPPPDALGKEITDLTRKLQQIVDEAQAEHDAASLARLKSKLRRFEGR